MKEKKDKAKKALEQPILDAKGKKAGTVTLSEKAFDGAVNMPLLHQAVMMYRANTRSGTASTKTRAQVRGGGKKPWRQKGTGRARTGSIRNPLWRGGGIIFGPKPRDYRYSMSKKARKGALKSSLNQKFMDDKLIIVNKIKLEKAKTKEFAAMLIACGVNVRERESVMVVVEKADRILKLASRNIPNLSLAPAADISAMDVLRHKKLVVEDAALNGMMRNLK